MLRARQAKARSREARGGTGGEKRASCLSRSAARGLVFGFTQEHFSMWNVRLLRRGKFSQYGKSRSTMRYGCRKSLIFNEKIKVFYKTEESLEVFYKT